MIKLTKLIVEATNLIESLGNFSITDSNNDTYIFYTSPTINSGDDFYSKFRCRRLIFKWTRNLKTPQLAFLPNTTPSGGNFTYTVSIYQNIIDDENLALLNNDLVARQSNIFWDLDYNSNAIQAVNQQAIIAASQQGGDLPKAFIQDYNYYSTPIKTRNYLGAKSTSPNVNQNTTSGGFGVLPNVELLNAAAYGINYGGGTSPEILGLGGTSLNNIYIVGNSRDAINIIPPSDPNYSTTINTSLEPGDLVTLYQYKGTSAQVPTQLEVVSTDVAVPGISSYMVPSTDTTSRAFFNTNISGGRPGFKFSINNSQGVYTVGRNSSGNYVTNNFLLYNNFTSEFITKFNSSPNNWYVSVYEKLDSPVVYNGTNATTAYPFKPYSLDDSLAFYGVAKITGVLDDDVFPEYGVFLDRDLSSITGRDIGGNGTNDYGILIWESQGNSIIVRNSTLSGVGQGLIYSEYAPTTLTENLDYISKTYANNSN
jgi:hypothetical protein